ncbi:MAG: 4-hydroxy-tetrahydrodipicolinate reductase [Clostridiales Family XIII bacterium]|jgi:4-hydroxy-tetrahydrodipicolinate reductase|nr:4-hydroxy-tetrahydrodipicolinate reductase [Clostridiales Family XIII bacterium]
MPKIIISGYGGRMGRALRALIAGSPDFADFEIVAGFDQTDGDSDGMPIFAAPDTKAEAVPRADVVIDFTNYTFVPKVLRYCALAKTPAVIATTALGERELALLRETAGATAVFHSANMSLGVNLTAKMAQLAAPALEAGFNIEIVEAHHNQKKDAPSGTAIMLAEAINGSLKERKELIFGRHGKDEMPELSQIGIHAVRGGTLPGRHTVMFAGEDELIEITHTAYSNKIFAAGALKAAAFAIGKPPGLYDMDDLLRNQ